MVFTGLDPMRARRLVYLLRQTAVRTEQATRTIRTAELLSEIPTTTELPLAQVHADCVRLAGAVERAVDQVVAFTIDSAGWAPPSAPLVPLPNRTPGPRPVQVGSGPPTPQPAPPRWDASPPKAWNTVHQESSHNSYQHVGGITALHDQGVRSFELDIHRGAPTGFFPSRFTSRGVHPLLGVAADHFDHAGGRPDDWRVYHVSGSAQSEYPYLSDGLQAVVALATGDPLTVFIDNKDPFRGSHTASLLDDVVQTELGDRLFTPADLLARAPGAVTLRQAIDQRGWPTAAELRGRILVVLTDHSADYPHTGSLFVAQDQGGAMHPNVVFHNLNHRRTTPTEIAALQGAGGIVRTYFNPRCDAATLEAAASAAAAANYRAIDIDDGSRGCEHPVPAPSGRPPVPVRSPG